MYSVEESLLRSRHSIGSEADKKRERDAECIQSEPPVAAVQSGKITRER